MYFCDELQWRRIQKSFFGMESYEMNFRFYKSFCPLFNFNTKHFLTVDLCPSTVNDLFLAILISAHFFHIALQISFWGEQFTSIWSSSLDITVKYLLLSRVIHGFPKLK